MLLLLLSHVRLFCDPMDGSWTIAGQAFLSMEFSRQEHWSGCATPKIHVKMFLAYSKDIEYNDMIEEVF